MTSQLYSLWATLPVMGVCLWMMFNAKPRKRHCCQQDRSLSPKKHGCIRVYSKCLVLEKANSHHTSRIKTGLPSGWKPHTSISSSPSPRNLIIYFLFLRNCLIQMFFISEVNDQWWFFETPLVLGLFTCVMLYSDLPRSAFPRIMVNIKHGGFLLGTGHTERRWFEPYVCHEILLSQALHCARDAGNIYY